MCQTHICLLGKMMHKSTEKYSPLLNIIGAVTTGFKLSKFILVCVGSCKLIETLESVPGTNPVLLFIAQRNNGLPLTGFEPTRLAILILLVRRVNPTVTLPLKLSYYVKNSEWTYAFDIRQFAANVIINSKLYCKK
jgi:hypothetical protein